MAEKIFVRWWLWIPDLPRSLSSGRPLRAGPVGGNPESRGLLVQQCHRMLMHALIAGGDDAAAVVGRVAEASQVAAQALVSEPVIGLVGICNSHLGIAPGSELSGCILGQPFAPVRAREADAIKGVGWKRK